MMSQYPISDQSQIENSGSQSQQSLEKSQRSQKQGQQTYLSWELAYQSSNSPPTFVCSEWDDLVSLLVSEVGWCYAQETIVMQLSLLTKLIRQLLDRIASSQETEESLHDELRSHKLKIVGLQQQLNILLEENSSLKHTIEEITTLNERIIQKAEEQQTQREKNQAHIHSVQHKQQQLREELTAQFSQVNNLKDILSQLRDENSLLRLQRVQNERDLLQVRETGSKKENDLIRTIRHLQEQNSILSLEVQRTHKSILDQSMLIAQLQQNPKFNGTLNMQQYSTNTIDILSDRSQRSDQVYGRSTQSIRGMDQPNIPQSSESRLNDLQCLRNIQRNSLVFPYTAGLISGQELGINQQLVSDQQLQLSYSQVCDQMVEACDMPFRKSSYFKDPGPSGNSEPSQKITHSLNLANSVNLVNSVSLIDEVPIVQRHPQKLDEGIESFQSFKNVTATVKSIELEQVVEKNKDQVRDSKQKSSAKSKANRSTFVQIKQVLGCIRKEYNLLKLDVLAVRQINSELLRSIQDLFFSLVLQAGSLQMLSDSLNKLGVQAKRWKPRIEILSKKLKSQASPSSGRCRIIRCMPIMNYIPKQALVASILQHRIETHRQGEEKKDIASVLPLEQVEPPEYRSDESGIGMRQRTKSKRQEGKASGMDAEFRNSRQIYQGSLPRKVQFGTSIEEGDEIILQKDEQNILGRNSEKIEQVLRLITNEISILQYLPEVEQWRNSQGELAPEKQNIPENTRRNSEKGFSKEILKENLAANQLCSFFKLLFQGLTEIDIAREGSNFIWERRTYLILDLAGEYYLLYPRGLGRLSDKVYLKAKGKAVFTICQNTLIIGNSEIVARNQTVFIRPKKKSQLKGTLSALEIKLSRLWILNQDY